MVLFLVSSSLKVWDFDFYIVALNPTNHDSLIVRVFLTLVNACDLNSSVNLCCTSSCSVWHGIDFFFLVEKVGLEYIFSFHHLDWNRYPRNNWRKHQVSPTISSRCVISLLLYYIFSNLLEV